MFQRFAQIFALTGVVLLSLSGVIHAAEYPKPRFPSFVPADPTDQNLLEAARIIVKRSAGDRSHPGYAIKPGERVLMVVKPFEDPRIVDALTLSTYTISF